MQERSHESRAHFLSFRSNLLCSQSSKYGRNRTLDLEKAILWARSGIDWEIWTKSCESPLQARGRKQIQ